MSLEITLRETRVRATGAKEPGGAVERFEVRGFAFTWRGHELVLTRPQAGWWVIVVPRDGMGLLDPIKGPRGLTALMAFHALPAVVLDQLERNLIAVQDVPTEKLIAMGHTVNVKEIDARIEQARRRN